MATNSKAMEDWFLRGGERPQENGMQQTTQAEICGVPEKCPVCGRMFLEGDYANDGSACCPQCGTVTSDAGEAEDETFDACEECEDHSMCDKCHHVKGEPDDGEKAEYSVTVKYWRKVRYEAVVDVEADNPADAVAQAREMYEDWDLDPEEIDSDDFGEPEFEVDPADAP